jgi:hypothetical protein
MSLAYADEAVHIRQLAPLTARDVARATGAGQRTVEAWLARTRGPSGKRAEQLLELGHRAGHSRPACRDNPGVAEQAGALARACEADRSDRARRLPARGRRARRARDATFS